MARLFAGVAFLAYGWALFGATCLAAVLSTVVTFVGNDLEPLSIHHVPNHKIRSTTLVASNARDKIESYESPACTYMSEVYTRAEKAVEPYTYIYIYGRCIVLRN